MADNNKFTGGSGAAPAEGGDSMLTAAANKMSDAFDAATGTGGGAASNEHASWGKAGQNLTQHTKVDPANGFGKTIKRGAPQDTPSHKK